MSGTDHAAHKQWEEAEAWIALAEEDLRVVEICLAAARPPLGSAAYHCQQAAEKLLKGSLVAASLPLRRTHDIETLATIASDAHPSLRVFANACQPFTPWGLSFRYPPVEQSREPPPEASRVREAMHTLSKLRDAVVELKPKSQS